MPTVAMKIVTGPKATTHTTMPKPKPTTFVGTDIYTLDRDRDGIACS